MRVIPVLFATFAAAATLAAPAANPYAESSFDDIPLVRPTPVMVTNWPTVQNVAGEVSVANLPLAEDGSVRVTSAPPAPQVLTELLAAPLDLDGGAQFLTVAVPATGFQAVGLRLFADNGSIAAYVEWHWTGDPADVFTGAIDTRTGDPNFAGYCWSLRANDLVHGDTAVTYICPIAGDSVRLRIRNLDGGARHTCTKASVYLIP